MDDVETNRSGINREVFETQILQLIEKLGIEVKSILEIGELWQGYGDLKNNKQEIYTILSKEGIGEGEIVFQKVSVFKAGDASFVVYSDADKRVNYKAAVEQCNIEKNMSISKGRSRMARNDEEVKNIMGVDMSSGTFMPFILNTDSIIMLQKRPKDSFINFRTSNGHCNIIKYSELKRLYQNLCIDFIEYSETQ